MEFGYVGKPDVTGEVHRNQMGKLELSKYKAKPVAGPAVQSSAG